MKHHQPVHKVKVLVDELPSVDVPRLLEIEFASDEISRVVSFLVELVAHIADLGAELGGSLLINEVLRLLENLGYHFTADLTQAVV